MSSKQEMQLLVDKIRKSSTTDEMTDNCIRLIVEYGGWVNIVPTYHNGLIDGYTVFEPGETYKYNNIFNIARSFTLSYGGSRGLCRSNTTNFEWRCKDFFLGTSAQSGAAWIGQLAAMNEKMGHRRTLEPGFCFYETFNKMDTLFRFCGDRVKGLSFDKRAEIDPKQTSWDNLIIELGYPD